MLINKIEIGTRITGKENEEERRCMREKKERMKKTNCDSVANEKISY